MASAPEKGPLGTRVVIIEDDDELATLIEMPLKAKGFQTRRAPSGEEGLALIWESRPDLLLLDIMLPGMSGFDVCHTLRHEDTTRDLPIIILSSNDSDEDIVRGLNLGADDYLTKPFSPSVLLARIGSVLRRAARPAETPEPAAPEATLACEGISLDVERFLAVCDGNALDLGVSEFRILQTLMSQRGKVLTRDQIIKAVHGENYPVTGRSVDVQIVSLRKKLGTYANLIETVRGIGYRFVE